MNTSAPTVIRSTNVKVFEIEGLLTPEQAADMLSISIKGLSNDRVTSVLGVPFVKIGRSVRYRPVDLREYIEARIKRPAVVSQ